MLTFCFVDVGNVDDIKMSMRRFERSFSPLPDEIQGFCKDLDIFCQGELSDAAS
jgi:hypothetical protein